MDNQKHRFFHNTSILQRKRRVELERLNSQELPDVDWSIEATRKEMVDREFQRFLRNIGKGEKHE